MNELKEQNIEFIYIKATEGSTSQDDRFAENWENAEKAGLLSGAYHFFSYDSAGKTQAENFINTVGKDIKGRMLPVVDVEYYGDKEEKDWLWYDTCFFDRSRGGGGVEYQIECHYAWPGFTVYMDGISAHVVKEEDWDALHVTEIEQVSRHIAADGSPAVYRYVLVFDPSAGWFVSIAGTADFETLEHIAREMEFTTLDEPAEPSGGDYSDYAYLGVGVG